MGRVHGKVAIIIGGVLFLASHESTFVTGQAMLVDGGLVSTSHGSRQMMATLREQS